MGRTSQVNGENPVQFVSMEMRWVSGAALALLLFEEADPSSKFAFRLLGSLLAMRLSDAVPGTAPTLTLPAAR